MAIDNFGIGVSVSEIVRRADHGDASVAHCYGGVLENPGVAHLFAFAGARGAGAGDDLGCVDEKERVSHGDRDFCRWFENRTTAC